MKLHLNTSMTQKIFTAHGKGYVAVSGERFEHSIVVTPEQVLTDWQPQGFDLLDETHFAYFFDSQTRDIIVWHRCATALCASAPLPSADLCGDRPGIHG